MSTELVEVPTIEHALEIVGSREVTIEDRGAAYALLHQIQLRINRVLRTAKDDLIVHGVGRPNEAESGVEAERFAS